MKRLKMRIWSKKENKYVRADYPISLMWRSGTLIHCTGKIVTNDFDIEVFTGLYDSTKWDELKDNEQSNWLLESGDLPKDWKGKEVYSGDIIESKYHDPSKMLVEFIEGGFCMTWNNRKELPIDIAHFYSSNGCMFKVIGDIHKDSELIGV